MTRERLQSLSPDELSRLSDKIGMDSDPEMDRDALIDSILEALEEDRVEREQLNNYVIRVKEKKYDISQNEELDFSDEEEYEVPEKYNETKIMLLLRDPLWAFAYWDIKDVDNDKFKNSSLFLRVHKKMESEKVLDFFDIPVSISDRSWYINLPEANSDYYVEIITTMFGSEEVLSKSNHIHSPRTELGQLNDSAALDNEKILLFSGLYDVSESSSVSKIPQRIISMLDNQYLHLKG